MSTSRRLPTSYNVKTYGDSSRDYTSLATWESDTDNDLVTAAKGEVLECYADSSSYSDYVLLDGATTNSSYFRVIKAASGEEHKGIPGDGVKFDLSTHSLGIQLQENYCALHDLELYSNANSQYAYCVMVYPNTVNYCLVTNCIAKSEYPGKGVGFMNQRGNNIKFINCLAYDCGYRGFWVYENRDTYFYNCTAVGCNIGFANHTGSSAVAKNCIAEDNTTNWYGTWTKTTCTDDDGVTFKDSSNDDYHLDSTDTVAKDQGTDLSSDSNFAFDDDVDGDTRSGTWDIGFDEYVSTSPTITYNACMFGMNF